MHSVLADVKKFFHFEKVTTDDFFFRCHYKITVIIHLLFMGLLGAKQYFGDPIKCTGAGMESLMETYCWIQGTWSIKELFYYKYHEIVAHPGIGYLETHFTRIDHTYYQWVPLVLFFSAVGFYFPRFIWKALEGRKMTFICEGLQNPCEPQERLERVSRILRCLSYRERIIYAQKYVFVEIINVVHLVIQWILTDWFLSGNFVDYGWKFLVFHWKSEEDKMEDEEIYNPSDMYFPKVSKCDWRQIAGEGTQDKKDAICVLPLNVINEKIYLVLWFWYFVLSIATIISAVRRFLVLMSHRCRAREIYGKLFYCNRDISQMIYKLRYREWFLIYQISKNVDQETFHSLIQCLSEYVRDNRKQISELESRDFYECSKRVIQTISSNTTTPIPENIQDSTPNEKWSDIAEEVTGSILNSMGKISGLSKDQMAFTLRKFLQTKFNENNNMGKMKSNEESTITNLPMTPVKENEYVNERPVKVILVPSLNEMNDNNNKTTTLTRPMMPLKAQISPISISTSTTTLLQEQESPSAATERGGGGGERNDASPSPPLAPPLENTANLDEKSAPSNNGGAATIPAPNHNEEQKKMNDLEKQMILYN